MKKIEIKKSCILEILCFANVFKKCAIFTAFQLNFIKWFWRNFDFSWNFKHAVRFCHNFLVFHYFLVIFFVNGSFLGPFSIYVFKNMFFYSSPPSPFPKTFRKTKSCYKLHPQLVNTQSFFRGGSRETFLSFLAPKSKTTPPHSMNLREKYGARGKYGASPFRRRCRRPCTLLEGFFFK